MRWSIPDRISVSRPDGTRPGVGEPLQLQSSSRHLQRSGSEVEHPACVKPSLLLTASRREAQPTDLGASHAQENG